MIRFIRKTFSIVPFVFAIYPFLFLYSTNMDEISALDILPWGLVAIASVLVLEPLVILIFKDKNKMIASLSLFYFLFFSYGHFTELTSPVIPNSVLQYIIYIAILMATEFLILRARKLSPKSSRFILIIGAILIVFTFFNITTYYFQKSSLTLDKSYYTITQKENNTTEQNPSKPDIYYIILDGYARYSTLKSYYEYSNDELYGFLEKKNFFIAEKSNSNYATTFLSLASSLNFEYLDWIKPQIGAKINDRSIPYHLIQNNRAASFLKTLGYKFIHFGSGWGPTKYNGMAAENLDLGLIDEFTMIVFNSSIARPFKKTFGVSQNTQSRINGTFEALGEIAEQKELTFAFAHIVCPHPPYIFDKDGGVVSRSKLTLNDGWKNKELYLDQLIYVNKKVKEMIENILAKSENPPIIIIQADHGTASSFYENTLRGSDDAFDMGITELPETHMLRERMGIFNAYYFPEKSSKLYDSISPVNTFRLIFDNYFNTSLGLIEDRSFFSTYNDPYSFTDISRLLIP